MTQRVRYELRCTVPTSLMARSGVTYFFASIVTFGLLLPWCVFDFVKTIINHSEIIEEIENNGD